MSDVDGLIELIHREIDRRLSGRHQKRYGLVTSYDPQKYAVKVMVQPDGFESGWIPIATHHIGNGWGILSGPVPGDGNSTGDQVELTPQEGDPETWQVTGRVHSDVDQPPAVQSGEILIKHANGSSMLFKQDNSIAITHGPSGATVTWDANGNMTLDAKTKNLTVKSPQIALNGPTSITGGAGSTVSINAPSVRINS